MSEVRGANGRVDFHVILELVAPGTRILDVGCNDGSLMALLQKRRHARPQGIELSQAGVNEAVARGLSVIQGDADTDLDAYPDRSFDYVILSQTLQATRSPRDVMTNLLRIGERAIVSFPNIGFWRHRLALLVGGKVPIARNSPEPWYASPNIHLCTIRDFVELSNALGATIEVAIALESNGGRIALNAPWWFWNLFGEQAVFLLRR